MRLSFMVASECRSHASPTGSPPAASCTSMPMSIAWGPSSTPARSASLHDATSITAALWNISRTSPLGLVERLSASVSASRYGAAVSASSPHRAARTKTFLQSRGIRSIGSAKNVMCAMAPCSSSAAVCCRWSVKCAAGAAIRSIKALTSWRVVLALTKSSNLRCTAAAMSSTGEGPSSWTMAVAARNARNSSRASSSSRSARACWTARVLSRNWAYTRRRASFAC